MTMNEAPTRRADFKVSEDAADAVRGVTLRAARSRRGMACDLPGYGQMRSADCFTLPTQTNMQRPNKDDR